MDVFNALADWVGWPAVWAITSLAASYGYFVMNQRIKLLKERNEELVLESADFSPDVLARRLADRMKLLNEELQILVNDHEAGKGEIAAKEAELEKVRGEIELLKSQLSKAEEQVELIRDRKLLCPYCESPLSLRESFPQIWEDSSGREIDYEIEYVAYECGLELRDEQVVTRCRNTGEPKTLPSP